MAALFSIPISSTGGSIVCTIPSPANKTLYLLTFTSPPDNRLTPIFIDAFLLALDVLEQRYPRGVLVTTSGIPKFYSNGLDLDIVMATEGFAEKWLWKLFRRFLTFPMPTIALINGHAFAGGLMLAMYHDYRIQNPHKGFLCINELEFGVPLLAPMMSVFRQKLAPSVFRDVVLEARRFAGPESLQVGLVDALGGIEETVGFVVQQRKLLAKAETGIYGTMKEEMYRESLGYLDDEAANVKWREGVEEKKAMLLEQSRRNVQKWEEQQQQQTRKNKL